MAPKRVCSGLGLPSGFGAATRPAPWSSIAPETGVFKIKKNPIRRRVSGGSDVAIFSAGPVRALRRRQDRVGILRPSWPEAGLGTLYEVDGEKGDYIGKVSGCSVA